MDVVRQELVYALRGLRRTPGFALVAVLLVALSVGVSTAVFSIVNAVYFSAVPYRDPGQLVLLQQVDTRPGCTNYCHRALTVGQVRDMPAGFGGIEVAWEWAARTPMRHAGEWAPRDLRGAVSRLLDAPTDAASSATCGWLTRSRWSRGARRAVVRRVARSVG